MRYLILVVAMATVLSGCASTGSPDLGAQEADPAPTESEPAVRKSTPETTPHMTHHHVAHDSPLSGQTAEPEADAGDRAAAPVAAATAVAGAVGSSLSQTPLDVPIARRAPKRLETHGHVRVDDYYWLRERENPEVISYLEAENAHVEAAMSGSEALQETLFEEMKGRLKEADSSVPYEVDGNFYYYRYREGGEYRVYCRRKGSEEADEEVILDVNEIAEGHE